MAGNTELFAAFQLFNQGVKDFTKASAVRQLNEQAADLTGQERAIAQQLEEARTAGGGAPIGEDQKNQISDLQKSATQVMEQRRALSGVATRTLSGLGFSAADTTAIAQSIFAPPRAVELQIEAQKELQQTGFEQRRQLQQERIELEAPGELAKVEAAGTETRIKLRSGIVKRIEKDTRESRENLKSIAKVPALLKTNTVAAFNLSKKLFVKMTDGGRITDQDFKLINVTPETWEDIKAVAKEKTFGEPTELAKKRLLQIAEVVTKASQRDLFNTISGTAESEEIATEGILPASQTQEILLKRFKASLKGFDPSEFGTRDIKSQIFGEEKAVSGRFNT